MEENWYAPYVCVRDQQYRPHEAEGFIMRREGRMVGLMTYVVQDDAILVLTQNSTEPGTGIGSALVLKMIEEARRLGVGRLWLTTTNDNLKSLGFYQRMGFRMVAVYRDAVTNARKTTKPSIPETGPSGLPIRDEIELELILKPYID